MNLSAIIMELEKLAREYESKLKPREQIASELEYLAEQMFRLAGRVRYNKENG